METWSLIISIFAFIVSLATFLHKLYTNRFNTTIKVLGIYPACNLERYPPNNGYVLKILFKNHSSNPISITSAYADNVLNFNKGKNKVSDRFSKLPIELDLLPVTIGSYGATELNLIFLTDNNLKDCDSLSIKINTSRKEINKVIDIKNEKQTLIKNISDIFD